MTPGSEEVVWAEHVLGCARWMLRTYREETTKDGEPVLFDENGGHMSLAEFVAWCSHEAAWMFPDFWEICRRVIPCSLKLGKPFECVVAFFMASAEISEERRRYKMIKTGTEVVIRMAILESFLDEHHKDIEDLACLVGVAHEKGMDEK